MSLVQSETIALNGIVYIAAGTDISLPEEVYLLSSLAKMGVDKGSQVHVHTTDFRFDSYFDD